jgi:hypothetical protein
MTMDITETLAPKSDQLDNIDLASGPRIFTVESVDVHKGSEQPVVVHLVEFDRPWKPGKTMRRVLADCWGVNSSKWPGQRVELFRDPAVTFGKEKPGGTRIRRISGIDAPRDVTVLIAQGRYGKYRVEPLKDAPPVASGPTVADVAACTDVATLRGWWQAANRALRAQIEQRVAELTADPAPDDHGADLLAMQAEAAEQEDER